MLVEISRELALHLIKGDVDPLKVERLEHGYRSHYVVKGTRVVVTYSYLSDVFQYYIQDINA